jgi:hypothetical protein
MSSANLPLRALRYLSLSRAHVFRNLFLSRGFCTSRAVWNHSESNTATSLKSYSDGSSKLEGELSIQPTDLLALYRGLVARGDINYDEEQVRAVMRVSKSILSFLP